LLITGLHADNYIIIYVKARIIVYVGHVSRINTNRIPKVTLYCVRNWIQKAEDRTEWHAVVQDVKGKLTRIYYLWR
jgi:hypothetical protein